MVRSHHGSPLLFEYLPPLAVTHGRMSAGSPSRGLHCPRSLVQCRSYPRPATLSDTTPRLLRRERNRRDLASSPICVSRWGIEPALPRFPLITMARRLRGSDRESTPAPSRITATTPWNRILLLLTLYGHRVFWSWSRPRLLARASTFRAAPYLNMDAASFAGPASTKHRLDRRRRGSKQGVPSKVRALPQSLDLADC